MMRWIASWMVMLCGAFALGAGFDECPAGGLGAGWRKAYQVAATGVVSETCDNGWRVTGFVPAPGVKPGREYRVEFDRKLAQPATGDFTAQLDLAWELPADKSFMGDVLLYIVTDKGTLAAEAGLTDGWLTGNARAAAYVGTPRKGDAFWVGDRSEGCFRITRKGRLYTIWMGTQKLEEVEGADAPIAHVRLFFRQWLHRDQHGKLLSNFGKIDVRRIAFVDQALPPPTPKVARVKKPSPWRLAEPIIGYWAGPEMNEALAAELAAGGWTLGWGLTETDLDILHRHGLKGILWFTVKPGSSPENARRVRLWLESLKGHPALLAIHCGDEPGGKKMLGCQKDVEFVAKHAPELLHFNNMFPVGARPNQLGHEGTPLQSYRAHISEYFERLHPQLLSYDKYHFYKDGDDGSYFLNQALVREAGRKYGVPTMNIVQACSWTALTRVPTGEEFRYLAYTSLAYGSKGLAAYVYGYPGHWGSVHDPATGKPGPLWRPVAAVNREFRALATELWDLDSIAVHHAGEVPFGGVALPPDAPFQLKPRLANAPQGLVEATRCVAENNNFFCRVPPIKGWLLGTFGKGGKPTHVLVVNLNYRHAASTTLMAPAPLERYDVAMGHWAPIGGNETTLLIPAGGGALLRVAPRQEARTATATAEWTCDYCVHCTGLKARQEGDALVIQGLENASAPEAEAFLDRVVKDVRGDFELTADLVFPKTAYAGDASVTLLLGVPNGETILGLVISGGFWLMGKPGYHAEVLTNTWQRATPNAVVPLRIVRQGRQCEITVAGKSAYTGKCDPGDCANLRLAVRGPDTALTIRNLRLAAK